jgi:hypothetical protein
VFDRLDAAFGDGAGWKIETKDAGHQSATPAPTGLDLSVLSPFLDGDPGRCLSSTVTLTRDGVFAGLSEGTLEVTLDVKPIPQSAEYWLRVETPIGVGHRLLNFTNRGVRTFTTEASLRVSDTVLTPGTHIARLVASGTETGLYLDGKKLGNGVYGKAYLPSEGTATEIQLSFPERFPARGSQDCPAQAMGVEMRHIRAASHAYFP